jgi:enoyl-CoA hydratase
VVVLTIARAHAANSLDTATREQLSKHLEEAQTDPDVRAVVITGEGTRVFCAGLDLGDVPDQYELGEGPVDRVARAVVPVVAAVNGAAVGGGFELALACDMVVAADHATFWFPEVTRAIVPTDGGTRLGQRIPLALASELVLTGRRLDAHEAASLGLVNRVVPAEDVVTRAVELARATCDGAPKAIAWAKELLRRSLAEDGAALRQAEIDVTRQVLASEEIEEGSRAFLEKRPPGWVRRDAGEEPTGDVR